MKKYILALTIILFCATIAYAACTGGGTSCTKEGTTYTCTDASYGCINDCVTAATRGDTINIGADTKTWASILTVKKSLTIKGAGIGNTNITCGGNYCIHFDMNDYNDSLSRSGNIRFEVSGFSFIGKGIYLNEADSQTVPFGKIVIANNRFINVAGNVIYIKGNFWGVAHGNIFDNCKAMTFLGNSRSSWDTFGAYGFAEYNQTSTPLKGNFYLENNSFINTTNFYVNSGHSGRYAFRYNTFGVAGDSPNFTFDSPMFDQHGLQSGAVYSLMGTEIYGNIFNLTSSRYWWEYLRGGKAVIFNNYITAGSGATQSSQIQYNYIDDNSISPVSNISTSVQKPNNDYLFINHINGVNQTWQDTTNYTTYPNMVGHELQANVDYFNYSATCSASDCSGGIGVGADTPTGTCTAGAAYWKTAKTNPTTPPDNMTDMISYSQAGKLYKCTSEDTWEVMFEPLIYPHPLRGTDEGGDETPPEITVTVSHAGDGASITHDGAYSVLTGGIINIGITRFNGWNGAWTGTCLNVTSCAIPAQGETATCSLTPTENCTVIYTATPIYLLN